MMASTIAQPGKLLVREAMVETRRTWHLEMMGRKQEGKREKKGQKRMQTTMMDALVEVMKKKKEGEGGDRQVEEDGTLR